MDKKKPKMKKESETPEETIARQQRAKWRFRAIVRFVMQNTYWLGDIEDQELGDDVHRNIALLTRKKERKSLLSLTDKSILNKRAEARTDSEKLHLSRIIGGLKCFRRYPSHVKSALAGVTYYYYYGPGRTIVRQGHESHSLYFIITGDVTISQEMFDPVLNEKVKLDLAIMGPGNMFGEVALLHDIPRTATITSNTDVELLCLMKKDFDVILKATVQEQWNEIQRAMTSFTYFSQWDDISVRECCILAKMKLYVPGQTLLGDGIGLPDFVYFILKGKCQVVEHLLVTSQKKGDTTVYKLYEPPPPRTKPATASKKSEPQKISDSDSVDTTGTVCTNVSSKNTLSRNPELTDNADDTRVSSTTVDTGVINFVVRPETHMSNPKLPSHVETHFMQVCVLNPTACFGVGENMAHRRVVASTYTECLLIPRYWLMHRNKGNIWNKIQQFLNSHIPTTRHVFNVFVNNRKWLQIRKQMCNKYLSNKNISNNCPMNVPYHIRIHDDIN